MTNIFKVNFLAKNNYCETIDMEQDPAVWPDLTDWDPAKFEFDPAESQLDPAKMAGYPCYNRHWCLQSAIHAGDNFGSVSSKWKFSNCIIEINVLGPNSSGATSEHLDPLPTSYASSNVSSNVSTDDEYYDIPDTADFPQIDHLPHSTCLIMYN